MGFSSRLSFGIEHAGPFQTDELIERQILEAMAARFLYKFRGDALDLRAYGFIDVYFEAIRLECFQIVRGDALHLQAHKFVGSGFEAKGAYAFDVVGCDALRSEERR